MGSSHFALLVALLLSVSFAVESDDLELDGRISRFEIIRLKKRIFKRSSWFTPEKTAKEWISFSALGRDFDIELVPGLSVAHPQMEMEIVDGEATTTHPVDLKKFYTGRLKGDKNAEVFFSHDNGRGVIGRIDLKDESIFLEPAAAHRKDSSVEAHEDEEILVYQASDVIRNLSGSFMVDLPEKFSKNGFIRKPTPIDEIGRVKREIEDNEQADPTENTRCPIKLIADYTFYDRIGSKSVPYTARYLISMIERVNRVFMKVDFGIDSFGHRMINMGLIVKKLRIHKTVTDKPLYNNEVKKSVDSGKLLESLAKSEANREYCLVHLVTAKILAEGVLGIAYPGQLFAENELEGQIPGICGGSEYCETLDHGFCLNAALTSVVGMYGEPLSTRESDLVMAHEFGHNFGARHDIDDPICVPGARMGGTFLMHPTAVRGYDPNNYKFSPCSIYSMNLVMKRHAHKCFKAPLQNYCGNGKVEENEDCDPGIGVNDKNEQNACCDNECHFKLRDDPNTCSPDNSPCCESSCTVSNSSTVCHEGAPDRCIAPTKCSGSSAECPKLETMPDGSECYDRGFCKSGECRSFCERDGLQPCLCENEARACLRCCRRSPSSPCQPHESRELMLNGSRCFYGTCNQGYCVMSTTDFVKYIQIFFETPTAFVKLVENNWVMIVVLMSLLLWLPASYKLHHDDEKQKKLQIKRAEAKRIKQLGGFETEDLSSTSL